MNQINSPINKPIIATFYFLHLFIRKLRSIARFFSLFMPFTEPENPSKVLLCPPPPPPAPAPALSSNSSTTTTSGGSSNSSPAATSTSTSLFASLFPSSASPATASVMEPPLLCLSSLFPLAPERRQSQPSPHISATALLQKAAQMGSSSSSSSFLRSLGLATSSTNNNAGGDVSGGGSLHWSKQKPLQQHAPGGLGLGLAYDSSGIATANLPELMMGSSSLFGSKPATLDFLSLGMSPAFMNSMGGAVGSSPPEKTWDAAADHKSNGSAFL